MDKKARINRIAIDAMGGDFAPANEVEGGVQLFADPAMGREIEVVFVGDEKKIKKELKKHDTSNCNYSIVNATQVVTMHDDPTAILKSKRDSSLFKALQLQAEGHVDAVISGGNTGAVLSTATVVLGRVKGVSRPTIGAFFPTYKKKYVLIMDVGANIDSKPKFLYEFAVMGSIYCRQMMGVENPSVGLLNIGEEETKGKQVILDTHQMLKESPLNFIGNIEGRDILTGETDVVICDGFEGNIILKFAESFKDFVRFRLKAVAKSSFLNKLMVGIGLKVIKKVFQGLDSNVHGGVPLLGVKGVAMIGHGKATAQGYKNLALKANEMVKRDINTKIENALNPPVINQNIKN